VSREDEYETLHRYAEAGHGPALNTVEVTKHHHLLQHSRPSYGQLPTPCGTVCTPSHTVQMQAPHHQVRSFHAFRDNSGSDVVIHSELTRSNNLTNNDNSQNNPNRSEFRLSSDQQKDCSPVCSRRAHGRSFLGYAELMTPVSAGIGCLTQMPSGRRAGPNWRGNEYHHGATPASAKDEQDGRSRSGEPLGDDELRTMRLGEGVYDTTERGDAEQLNSEQLREKIDGRNAVRASRARKSQNPISEF